MRYASIDAGTNTFRLLIAEPHEGGLRRLLVENRITRLGEALPRRGGPLHPPAVARALAALGEFRSLMDAHQVGLHRAVGTSALRRASDAAAFLATVRERLGLKIEVIPGLEEARLTASGVLWSVKGRGSRQVVFDIGGGSTEFGLTENGRLVASRSLELGVVALTERWLTSDPPQEAELAGLKAEVAAALAEVSALARQVFRAAPVDSLIATAGTPTTLAAMLLGLTRYEPERVNGYVLHRADLETLLSDLAAIPALERLRLPGLVRGREDIILAGICIVLGAMLSFDTPEVVVSDGGLLEGVLLDLLAHPAKGASFQP